MKTLTPIALVLGLALAGTPSTAQQSADPHAHQAPPPAAGKHLSTPNVPSPGMGGMMGGQGMNMMQDGPGMQGMQMGPGKHVEGRLAFLRAEIGISEVQTPAWNSFADAVRKASKDMMMAMPMMAPKAAKGDWLGNLERHEKMMASHIESLHAIRASAEPLYAALSEDQKRIANELMAGPMGPMGGMSQMMRM